MQVCTKIRKEVRSMVRNDFSIYVSADDATDFVSTFYTIDLSDEVVMQEVKGKITVLLHFWPSGPNIIWDILPLMRVFMSAPSLIFEFQGYAGHSYTKILSTQRCRWLTAIERDLLRIEIPTYQDSDGPVALVYKTNPEALNVDMLKAFCQSVRSFPGECPCTLQIEDQEVTVTVHTNGYEGYEEMDSSGESSKASDSG